MSVEDLHERAVDQLVDETLARLHELHHLLATAHLPSWAGANVRTAAAHVIAQLTTGPSRSRTARALLTSLWYTDDPARVPDNWWPTPLGGLLLDRMRPAAPAINTSSNPRVARRLAATCEGLSDPLLDVFALADNLTSR
jgi:hypothetical protein